MVKYVYAPDSCGCFPYWGDDSVVVVVVVVVAHCQSVLGL